MNHPIENIMNTSMEHIKSLADVDTVIGSPIMADENTMILPVSKVSLGMLVGGGEYIAAMTPKKSNVEINCDGNYPFIGTSTLGMSLTPLAFLAVQNGTVRVLPAKQDCAAERIIDLMPQVLDAAERLINEYAGGCADEKSRRKRFKDCRTKTYSSTENHSKPAEQEPAPEVKINIEYDEDEEVRE